MRATAGHRTELVARHRLLALGPLLLGRLLIVVLVVLRERALEIRLELAVQDTVGEAGRAIVAHDGVGLPSLLAIGAS